jgi:membrane protein required for colicin V production
MIDIVAGICTVLAIVQGFRQGLILAIFSLLAYIIGLAAAMQLSASVAVWLQNKTGTPMTWLPFVSFLLVFLAVILVVRFTGALVQGVFTVTMLGWVNRIGGVVFYLATYAIILSIFLFFAAQQGWISTAQQTESAVYGTLAPMGPQVVETVTGWIPFFSNSFQQLQDYFGNLQHKIPS